MSYFDDPTPRISGRARQRYVRRQSGSANRLVQGCLILFTLCAAGLVFFVLILAPVMFRLLPYEDQGRITRRIAFLSPWMFTETPTPTFIPSPTVDQARINAGLALLDDAATGAPPTAVNATPLFAPTATRKLGNNTLPTAPPKATTALPATSATQPPAPSVSAPTLVAPSATPAAIAAAPIESPVPTNTVYPTPVPATEIPLPSKFHMTRYEWVPQKWNNCGPANLTQVLNGYGVAATQDDIASWLKPNKNDANVSPWQIVTYVTKFTRMKAIQRVNGSLKLLKTLMVAKFRPIIETGLISPKDGSWEGHYLTPIGYDDTISTLFGLDTLLGAGSDNQGVREDYADLDSRWEHFNRVYIVVYPAEREEELRSILGADADPTANVQRALAAANAARKANPANPFAWFNVGTNYVLLRDYRQAAAAFDLARTAGAGLPWRMNWYQFTMISAYYNIGDYATALDQINTTIANQKNVEELFYWRGLVEYAQSSVDLAKNDINQAYILNPNFKPAVEAMSAINNKQKLQPFDTP